MGLFKRNKKNNMIPLSDSFYGDYPVHLALDINSFRVQPKDILTTECYFNLSFPKGNNVVKQLYDSRGNLVRQVPTFITTPSEITRFGGIIMDKYIFVYNIYKCFIYFLDGTLYKSFPINDMNLLPDTFSIFHYQNKAMFYRGNGSRLVGMTESGVLLGNIPWDYFSTIFFKATDNEFIVSHQLSSSSGYEYMLYSFKGGELKLIRKSTYSDAIPVNGFRKILNQQDGGYL